MLATKAARCSHWADSLATLAFVCSSRCVGAARLKVAAAASSAFACVLASMLSSMKSAPRVGGLMRLRQWGLVVADGICLPVRMGLVATDGIFPGSLGINARLRLS